MRYFSGGRLLPYNDEHFAAHFASAVPPTRQLESTPALSEVEQDVLPPLTPFRSRPVVEFPHLSRTSSLALTLLESRGIAQGVAGSGICGETGGKGEPCPATEEKPYPYLVTFEEVDSDDPR